jgi:uncharacterized protein
MEKSLRIHRLQEQKKPNKKMSETRLSIQKFMTGFGHGMAAVAIVFLIIIFSAWINTERFKSQRISDIPFEMLILLAPPQNAEMPTKTTPSHSEKGEAADITESVHAENNTIKAPQEHPTDAHQQTEHNVQVDDNIPEPHANDHKEQQKHVEDEVHTEEHTPDPVPGYGHESIHAPAHTEYTGKPLYKPDLIEESEYGPLPRISTMGKRPFDAYKHPFRIPEGQKLFSLVIAPVGISEDLTSAVINKLPRNVTLAFSPYMQNYQPVFTAARTAGKEIWTLLPLEQHNPLINDTGPLSLRADFSLDRNRENFYTVLGSTSSYTGLIALDADTTTLSFGSARNHDIIREIEQRGLGLAYTSALPISEIQASFVREPALHIPKLSDDPFKILKPRIENIINSKESVVIVLRPYPAEINAITEWLRTLPSKGFILAPLSAHIAQINTKKEE